MNFRTLITYSPYLLSVLVVLGIIAAPSFALAQGTGESWIKGVIYFIIVNFTGMLLGLAGIMLDYAINTFVIGFGLNVTSSGVGVAIDEMWILIRDFFNILFIFGLVYIGFKMILNSDDSRTRSTLVTLIMAALLVNFSLFITKFIVDFSNILATEIACSSFELDDKSTANDCNGVVVAKTFFNHMGIAQTYDASPAIKNDQTESWGFIFGSAIINLVGTFVFLSGAFMLIIRYVALCIFMIFSPFMFAGWVFPYFSSTTSKYWTGFLGRAFYAPVFILLLFFSANILQRSIEKNAIGGKLGELNASGVSTVALEAVPFSTFIIPFLVTSAFMIAAVQVAGKLSADGAGAAMNVGRNIAQGGQRRLKSAGKNAGLYVPRLAGQYGAYAAGAATEKTLNATQRTRLGRLVTNNKLFGSAVNDSIRGAAKSGKNAKLGLGSTINERGARRQALSSSFKRDDTLLAAEKIDANTSDSKQIQLLADARTAANEISMAALEEMSEADRNNLTKYLKAPTVAKLLESDKLSPGAKGSMSGAYKKVIYDKILTKDNEVITEELQKLSTKQLEILGDQFVREHAAFFADKQMDDLKKSDVFSDQQKSLHKDTRKDMFKKFAKGTPVKISRADGKGEPHEVKNTKEYLFNETKRDSSGKFEVGKPLKPTEIASRSFETFVTKSDPNSDPKDPNSYTLNTDNTKFLNAAVMRQIARNEGLGKGSMDDNEMRILATKLEGNLDNTPSLNNYLDSKKGREDFFLGESPANSNEPPDQSSRGPSSVLRADGTPY